MVCRRNPAVRLPRERHALGKISRHFDHDLVTVLEGLGRPSFRTEGQRADDTRRHRDRWKQAQAVVAREQLGDFAPAKPLGRGLLHYPVPHGRGAEGIRTTGAALVMMEGESGDSSPSRLR